MSIFNTRGLFAAAAFGLGSTLLYSTYRIIQLTHSEECDPHDTFIECLLDKNNGDILSDSIFATKLQIASALLFMASIASWALCTRQDNEIRAPHQHQR